MLPNRVFVLGGAASGKSAWAEKFAESYGSTIIYLATAQAFDDEMHRKIKIHKNRRDARWRTFEAPLDPGPALGAAQAGEPVLIDCATMWLSNHMLAESDLPQAQEALLNAIARAAAPVIIVSNEVGHGVVPDNALARQFREAQGRLNIALAAQAELAVQVIAGIPQVLKGTLP